MDFKPIKIGKYLLLERLATGGMAEVYRAKASGAGGFEKQLAIKRILPSYTSNEEFQKMFEYEARLTSALTHSNIVQIYDFVKTSGNYLLAMEYVNGKNLRQVVNKLKKLNYNLPIECSLFIINETCKGLEYAHAKKDDLTGKALNIIHRDMSPQNIMLSYEGSIKIVDFGIAKAKDKVDETRSGVIKGKFGYMSPEQANGASIDFHSDIFSTGIILWELLTGKRLFSADGDLATLKLIQDCVVAKPSSLNPKITPELEKIILKALAKDVTQRYQTAGFMQRQLQEYLNKQYPSFSGKELGDLMQKIFASEIQVENKRFEQLYRESIPFSQGERPTAEEDAFVEEEALEGSITSTQNEGSTSVTNIDEEEVEEDLGEPSESAHRTAKSNQTEPATRAISKSTSIKLPKLSDEKTEYDSSRLEKTQVTDDKMPLVGKEKSSKYALSEKNRLADITQSPSRVSQKLSREEFERTLIETKMDVQLDRPQRPRLSHQPGSLPNPRVRHETGYEESFSREEETSQSRKPLIAAAIVFMALTGYLYRVLLSGSVPVRVEESETRATGSCDPKTNPNCPRAEAVVPPSSPVAEQVPSAVLTNCEVKFESDPPGAKILIDGSEKMVTPGTILIPCNTAVNYTLNLEGYESIGENYFVKKSGNRVFKTLKKVPMGELQLIVNRRVQIFSDTDYLGDASPNEPFVLRLRADTKHMIRFKNEIFGIDTTQSFTVEPGRVLQRNIRLDDPTPSRNR